jgi:hypothetical protein
MFASWLSLLAVAAQPPATRVDTARATISAIITEDSP